MLCVGVCSHTWGLAELQDSWVWAVLFFIQSSLLGPAVIYWVPDALPAVRWAEIRRCPFLPLGKLRWNGEDGVQAVSTVGCSCSRGRPFPLLMAIGISLEKPMERQTHPEQLGAADNKWGACANEMGRVGIRCPPTLQATWDALMFELCVVREESDGFM